MVARDGRSCWRCRCSSCRRTSSRRSIESWRAVESVDALSVGGGGGGGLYGGVMQQLRLIFGVSWPNWPVQLAGTVLLMLPLAKWRNWQFAEFRMRFLCALLVYMVIFNHQSESPSFVIAVTGIAIWFVITPRSWWRTTADGADDSHRLDLVDRHHAEELAAELLRALPAQDNPVHARVARDDVGAVHLSPLRARRSSRARMSPRPSRSRTPADVSSASSVSRGSVYGILRRERFVHVPRMHHELRAPGLERVERRSSRLAKCVPPCSECRESGPSP